MNTWVFPPLAIVNDAATNMAVWVPVWVLVFNYLGHVSKSGTLYFLVNAHSSPQTDVLQAGAPSLFLQWEAVCSQVPTQFLRLDSPSLFLQWKLPTQFLKLDIVHWFCSQTDWGSSPASGPQPLSPTAPVFAEENPITGSRGEGRPLGPMAVCGEKGVGVRRLPYWYKVLGYRRLMYMSVGRLLPHFLDPFELQKSFLSWSHAASGKS